MPESVWWIRKDSEAVNFDRVKHVLQGHLPFNSSCDVCVRSRGLPKTARERPSEEIMQHEVQIDQFFKLQKRFVVLVHTRSFALGCVDGELSREALLESIAAWLRFFGLSGVQEGVVFRCDAEPYMRTLLVDTLDKYRSFHGPVEQFAPGRHAPAAERGVRTLRELGDSILIELQDFGVSLRNHHRAFALLYAHCCHTHNRYNRTEGSELSPLQRLRGNQHKPHQIYAFGSTVCVQANALEGLILGRFAFGAYLGPVMGKTSHLASVRVTDGSMKLVQASSIKAIVPLRYDVELLGSLGRRVVGGLRDRPPALGDPNDPDLKTIPLSLVPGGNPPASFFEEHGKTKRCTACQRGSTHSTNHSRQCRRRYQAWLQGQLAENEEPRSLELPRDQVGLGDFANVSPNVGLELPDDVDVELYQPSEPADDQPYLPDFGQDTQPAEPEGEVPGWLRDAPAEAKPDPAGVDVEMSDQFVETITREPLSFSSEQAMASVVESVYLQSSVYHAVEDESWVNLSMRGKTVCLQKPKFLRDDTTGKPLDPELTAEGMCKEVRALDSLAVGDLVEKSEAEAFARHHNVRILSTRWVAVDKKDGETKEKIVRARIVVRDYATGGPTAQELGISSPTSSNEAFRTFLIFISSKGGDIILADVSTAFLFAEVVGPEVVMLPPNIRYSDNSRVYMRLRKALYGLRSASLAWYRMLADMVESLGLRACETEKTVFTGWFAFEGDQFYMVLLVYVDDLMIGCLSTRAARHFVSLLAQKVKIKVTGILSVDGKVEFLGRRIRKDPETGGILVSLPEAYFHSTYQAYGIKKSSATPPDLRKILDDGMESQQTPLSPEASSRYRSAVGKVAWGAQTRVDLTYFISVLSRGQSQPLAVHEACLRAFLRYLMTVEHREQLLLCDGCEGNIVVYVDSNWASERNNSRRSLSGGVLFVDGAPVKAYTRQQTSIALSSAEAELTAICEGMKEGLGLYTLIQHVFGQAGVPVVKSDSQAAINISSMYGLLRRVRHIDIRLCWVQETLREQRAVLEWVSGLENVADIFTKSTIQRISYGKHLGMLGIVERRAPTEVFEVDAGEWDDERICAVLGKVVDWSVLEELESRLGNVNPSLVYWLVIEFCTSAESNMGKAACEVRGVKVIRITEKEDGLADETIAILRSHIERLCRLQVCVLVWSSTPCTGGCTWQYIHRQRDGYEKYLKKVWGIQRKLFAGFQVLCREVEDLRDGCLNPFVAIEWPKTCQYWHWRTTKNFLVNHHRELESSLVHGCAVGLVDQRGVPVKKIWRVDTDLHALRELLQDFRCPGNHAHSESFDLKETQHYPVEMCKRILSCLP